MAVTCRAIFDCALMFFEVWSFAIPKFGIGEVDLY
jgi:hypothetical protein